MRFSARVHFGFISTQINRHREARGDLSEVAMKTPLSIVLAAVVLVAGSSLAIMNSACKSSLVVRFDI